jgi:hypothetical protein
MPGGRLPALARAMRERASPLPRPCPVGTAAGLPGERIGVGDRW